MFRRICAIACVEPLSLQTSTKSPVLGLRLLHIVGVQAKEWQRPGIHHKIITGRLPHVIDRVVEKSRLPAMYPFRLWVEAGGLMAYGTDLVELWRRLAENVHEILNGANPGDIPIYQPTKFELLINLKTARALALTLPPPLLARADRVIE